MMKYIQSIDKFSDVIIHFLYIFVPKAKDLKLYLHLFTDKKTRLVQLHEVQLTTVSVTFLFIFLCK